MWYLCVHAAEVTAPDEEKQTQSTKSSAEQYKVVHVAIFVAYWFILPDTDDAGSVY